MLLAGLPPALVSLISLVVSSSVQGGVCSKSPSSGSIVDCITLWRAAYLHNLQQLLTALLLPDLPACLQMI